MFAQWLAAQCGWWEINLESLGMEINPYQNWFQKGGYQNNMTVMVQVFSIVTITPINPNNFAKIYIVFLENDGYPTTWFITWSSRLALKPWTAAKPLSINWFGASWHLELLRCFGQHSMSVDFIYCIENHKSSNDLKTYATDWSSKGDIFPEVSVKSFSPLDVKMYFGLDPQFIPK